jgi:L,D-transpeptidase-like protein
MSGMRRALVAVIAAIVSTAVSCGGEGEGSDVGRPVRTEPVSLRTSRPRPPGDVAVARFLAHPGTLLARVRTDPLDVHAAPGTKRPYLALAARNPWRQRLRLLVLKHALDERGRIWLRVQLPIWPNGQEGWVAASDVGLSAPSERLVVDVSDRTLVRMRGRRVVARLPVGVGAAGTPTPPGRYVVWAKVRTGRPLSAYGSYILGLSGFSDAIDPSEWSGEPRLAIHGTADPSDAGRAVSNGCIRVPNALLRQVRDVPMGTPVVIRR